MVLSSATAQALSDFAEEMGLVLERHQKEKGDSWQGCPIEFLESKLREEVEEYLTETHPAKKAKEAVDIANIAMMLWVRQTKRNHDQAMRRKAERMV